MTSDEISKDTLISDSYWLREIAYQLAQMNEREDYRLFCLEDEDNFEDEEPTGGPIPIDA